jgi:hypothetical protein
MARFNIKEILNASPELMSEMAGCIQDGFQKEGYQVSVEALSNGGYDISITKGGLFKAVLGMKTALKVTLLPQGTGVSFEAGVGIWKQQAVPTIISMLVFWPVILTQLCGLVEQAELDDKALALAKSVIPVEAVPEKKTFCPYCGARNAEEAQTCKECGRSID